MNKRLFCLLLLLLLLPSIADAYTMRDHPRFFLRNAAPDPDDWLDSLQARAAGTHATQYNRLKARVDAIMVQGSSYRNETYAHMAAFVGLIEEDTAYTDWAINVLMERYRAYGTSLFYGDTSGGEMGQIKQATVCYDWLYNLMPAARRDSIGVALGAWVNQHGEDGLYSAPWLPTYKPIGPIIAVYGDRAANGDLYCTTYEDDFTKQVEKLTYTDTETGWYIGHLTGFDEISDGGIYGYSGKRYQLIIGLLEAVRSATGEDQYYALSDFLQGAADFWMHRVRSDNGLLRTIGKWNQAGSLIANYCAWASNSQVYDDNAARKFASLVYATSSGNNGDTAVSIGYSSIYWYLIYFEPGTESDPSSLSFIDRDSGMVLSRNRWTRSTMPFNATTDTTTVVHMSFHPMRADLTSTQAPGHIYICRGRDALISHSGKYLDHDMNLHYNPYYIQSYAWNCLDIYKPNEPFGTIPWGDMCCLTDPNGLVIPSIGNSSGPTRDCADSASVHLPGADGAYGYRGHVAAAADTGGVLYTRGDMTEAYSFECNRSRATQVEREVVWYRPNVFVIRDIVERVDSTYTVTARFHTLHRPALDDSAACSCITVEGAAWADSLGGVYRVPGMRQFKITRTNSSAWFDVVRPSKYAGMVSLVGGPNADGTSWKQDWEPDAVNNTGCSAIPNGQACAGTYVEGKTSYEFYIDGKNYPPSSGASARFSPGTLAAPAAGNESADWTILIQAPENEPSVEMIYTIVVGADDQAEPYVTSSLNAGTRTVTVSQGATEWVFTFDDDGYFLTASKN